MRLSEAIRLGAMLKPQGFGNQGGLGQYGATCAMGAIYDAIGALDAVNINLLRDVFEIFAHVRAQPCPACQSFSNEYGCDNTIVHLNDEHRWTREQIADWVASVEAAQAIETPASVDAEDRNRSESLALHGA